MTRLSRRIPWASVALAALLAPAVSLLTSQLVVGVVGDVGLGWRLPAGLHSYVPGTLLLGRDTYVHASQSLAALAGIQVLLLVRRHGASGLRRRLAVTLALAVPAVVTLHGVELLSLQLFQGVPDSMAVTILAGLLPGVAAAGWLVAGWSLVALFAGTPKLALTYGWRPASAVASAYGVSRRAPQFDPRHPRRGPPLLLPLTA